MRFVLGPFCLNIFKNHMKLPTKPAEKAFSAKVDLKTLPPLCDFYHSRRLNALELDITLSAVNNVVA